MPNRDSVRFTGRLPDVKDAVGGAVATVVPLLVGGGTRLKVLESLALGTPVVSTAKGVEGLDVVNGTHALVSDTADRFSADVLRLLDDPALAARLSSEGRALVRSTYTWEAIGRRLLEVVAAAREGIPAVTDTRSSGPAIRLGLAGALACLALASAPYVVGFAAAPEGLVYPVRCSTFPTTRRTWSWVTSSRRGLFIPNTMTPEPNAATFLNPAMWLLAQVQALFGLSFAALFQWWRVAAAVVVGPALAVTMLRLARSSDQARVAFWLALAGGGFGWIFVVAKYAFGLADAPFPEAIYFAEPNTWFGLFAYPYLPLAQGFMLIALIGAFRVHTAPGPGAWAACAAGALGVALLHAYDLVVVYAVVGTFWIVELDGPGRSRGGCRGRSS